MMNDPPSPSGLPGGAMPLDLKNITLPPKNVVLRPGSLRYCFTVAGLVLLCAAAAVSQKSSNSGSPKYDRQTEMKTTGVVEEINVLTVGSRKDFTELVLKSGDDKLHIYVCPKPFQDEMGITFIKGDALAVTGSKVKEDESDVILAREMVKGTDTLMFRDEKGKPVWDDRTGK
jgi:hypothetical protein